jgi:hypothetical protein
MKKEDVLAQAKVGGYAIVRMPIAEVCSRASGPMNSFMRIDADVYFSSARLKDIISIEPPPETDAERISRLEAELAKAPRRIEWNGGECPVRGGTSVAVWKRNGGYICGQAACFEWVHLKSEDYQGLADIIAYMVLPS